MKKVTTVLLAMCVLTTSALAERISVKDFGAKGDGKTDDTEAIQKAMDACGKKYKTIRDAKGKYVGASGPELVFPAGRYVINDRIEVKARKIIDKGNIEKILDL